MSTARVAVHGWGRMYTGAMLVPYSASRDDLVRLVLGQCETFACGEALLAQQQREPATLRAVNE